MRCQVLRENDHDAYMRSKESIACELIHKISLETDMWGLVDIHNSLRHLSPDMNIYAKKHQGKRDEAS